MDLGGAPLLKQPQDFDIEDVWLPATPARTIPTRRPLVSSPNPSYWPRSHSYGSSWLDPTVAHAADGVQTMTTSRGIPFLSGSCSTPGMPSTMKYLNGDQVAAQVPANHTSIAGDIRLHNSYMNNGNLSSSSDWSPLLSGDYYTASRAATVDSMPPLTPLMMQISQGQEIPVPSNNMQLNGKVLLAASFCNSNHSNRCSLPGGSPGSCLRNLNSVPESVINTTWNVPTVPSFPTPATTDRFSKRLLDEQKPLEVIDLVDVEVRDENPLEKEVSSSQLLLDSLTDASFSNLMASFHCSSFQKPECVNEMAVLSKEFNDSVIGIDNPLTISENKDAYLNNDNKQKTKRRKHRPKVIHEQKSARTPKPATPMLKTPRLATANESSSGKRKYVRRKNTNPLDSYLDSLGEIVDPENRDGAKSVKRCLNFGLEASHVTEKTGSMSSSQQNSEIHHFHLLCDNDTVSSSTMKETVNSAELQGAVVENSLTGIVFDFNNSHCELQNDYLKILQAPVLPANQNMGTLEGNAESNAILDAPPKVTKRDYGLSNETCERMQKNLTYSSYVADLASRNQSSDILVSCLQEIHSKMRVEKAQSRMASIPSSKLPYTSLAKLVYTPSTGWKTIPVSNDSKELTDADDLAKVKTSENILSSEKTDGNIHENPPPSGDNLTSLNLFMDDNWKLTPVKPSRQKDVSQPSTPDKPSRYSTSQESRICGALVQFEASKDANTLVKAKGRGGRKKREQVLQVYPMNSSSNKAWLLDQQVTYGTSAFPRKINSGLNKISSFLQGQNSQVFSVDSHNISNNNISTHSSSSIGPLVPYMDPLEDIIQKLRRLSINEESEVACSQSQNALVPYVQDGGMMVSYQRTVDLIKRQRPRAKVDLDPETNRVWNLLMGKNAAEADEGAKLDKEKWWEEERRIFRGRVDSFIARMHLVQGDRRFSQWKGSVVDSVIGVFLTQNVSDHLSSSAFMSLAAKFPLRTRDNYREPNAEKVNAAMENDSNPELQKNLPNHGLGCQASSVENVVKIGCQKETSNSNETLGSGTGSSSVDNCKGKGSELHETEVSYCYESADTVSGPAGTATCSTSLDASNKRLTDEVVSSQNSMISSQSSTAFQVQSDGQFRTNSLLSSENTVSELGNRSNDYGNSSFTELLQMAESSSFQKLCGHSSGKILATESSIVNSQAGFGIENSVVGFGPVDNYKGVCQSGIYDSNLHMLLGDTVHASQFCHSLYPLYSETMRRKENTLREDTKYHSPSNTCEITSNPSYCMCGESKSENSAESDRPNKFLSTSTSASTIHSNVQHDKEQKSVSETELGASQHIFCQRNFTEMICASSNNENFHVCSSLQGEYLDGIHLDNGHSTFKVESSPKAFRVPEDGENSRNSQANSSSNNNIQNRHYGSVMVGSNMKGEAYNFHKVSSETPKKEANIKRRAMNEKKAFDWDSLRKEAYRSKPAKERSSETMDSLDYEALRCADVNVISETIRERGMNNMLAERIKDFLNRLVRDHGSTDLEWLRDVPPDKSKDYLLSIRGLGLKSTECVRLLTLHHLAFPVDTNVGRICVRLGWVPLQPLPESLQLHLLELYPVLETIQKYLWPRLCKLDQRTLYELHYQMITFGKVFCTKSKPNCNACPMRGECKHFASAFASARLALPAPEDKSIVCSTIPIASEISPAPSLVPGPIPQIGCDSLSRQPNFLSNSEPIIEEPTTPEPGCVELLETAIEDAFYEDPEEIPTIKLNLEKFTQNLQNYMQENMEIQDGDMSKALVALTPEAASIPMPKLKNISRLRTEHQVYEIPDSHPLLDGFDQREPDDPCPYLLAIWTPGETAQSIEAPQAYCNSQNTGQLCENSMCFACSSIREAQAHKVRGTLLIPCRTAMRGSFPLNGTYFQVNEVFADHHSSRNPFDVPRNWIWNLPRRTVFFGTSIPTIFRGLTTHGIQHCFWRGFVCVRGFDRVTRAPKPLYARLHFPASKGPKNKKSGAAAVAATREEEYATNTSKT
ncbi:Transcriptional activator DEMETER [Apostasia shenzhenica]|uniref:Transcriptional activator DEMETER n=1 Tax=Apostasia shenzhenica TaxID=1088818 RepID=A0A2I0AEJ8_9ASPA|nr:Transcriptional activator DEMETER [Apostasia shenzhenica]